MNEQKSTQVTSDYAICFAELKQHIALARRNAALSLNSALIELYWQLGAEIVEQEKNADWGSGLIERLSRDLALEFPDIRGFSRRNLYAVRQWYLFYSARSAIVPQPVAQIPWGHNRLIIGKIKDIDEALWYAAATVENGWARDVLELKIAKAEYSREGKSLSNFHSTLPAEQSSLAQETLKDPYNFDFLGLEDDAQERAIEVEYSLRDINKPIGVSDYLLSRVVPENMVSQLPTVSEFEDELALRLNESMYQGK